MMWLNIFNSDHALVPSLVSVVQEWLTPVPSLWWPPNTHLYEGCDMGHQGHGRGAGTLEPEDRAWPMHEARLPGSLGTLHVAQDREEPHTVPSASIHTNPQTPSTAGAELLSHLRPRREFLSRRWRSISPNPARAGLHRRVLPGPPSVCSSLPPPGPALPHVVSMVIEQNLRSVPQLHQPRFGAQWVRVIGRRRHGPLPSPQGAPRAALTRMTFHSCLDAPPTYQRLPMPATPVSRLGPPPPSGVRQERRGQTAPAGSDHRGRRSKRCPVNPVVSVGGSCLRHIPPAAASPRGGGGTKVDRQGA